MARTTVTRMSKSNRQRRAAKRRTVRRRDRAPHREPAEPDLFTDVRTAITDPDPLHLVSYVSSLLAAIDPRENRHPFAQAGPTEAAPAREDLVAMFIDVATPETTALLAVIAALSSDDVLRARVRRELAGRGRVEPQWSTRLGQTATYRATRMGHVLGDGDNIMLGVRLAGTYEVTVVVYVDHHLGTLVKDAFVVPESVAEMVTQFQRIGDDPDLIWQELSLADARAWIEEAIQVGAMTFPPLETESWPACRPVVEWLIRELPGGGTGYVRPHWDSPQLARLTDRFFASRWGVDLDDVDNRDLLESLLWYATDYGPGDPLRWSAVKVEMLLSDWLPRKVIAPAEYLALAPDLLQAFVRFVHDEAGVRPDLTDETVAAIDACRPQFRQAIDSAVPVGAVALLSALSGGDADSFEVSLLDRLARDVGGRAELTRLDATPLPDEPFQWAGVPDDVSAKVAEVLALADGCCTELLDVEYRTACRRVLARVASVDPAFFRRKGRAETAAAALVWIVGKANSLFGRRPGHNIHLQVKDVTGHFGSGAGSASQRAASMLRAGGFSDDTYDVCLGSPDFLIAPHRQWLVTQRDSARDLAVRLG